MVTALSAKHAPFKSRVAVGNATFSLGAEAANVRRVTVQLKDMNGNNLAHVACLQAFFTNVGSTNFAAAPAGGVAIGTKGALLEPVNNQLLQLLTDATGAIELDITDASGAITHYLAVVLPDGTVVNSGAIAFAA